MATTLVAEPGGEEARDSWSLKQLGQEAGHWKEEKTPKLFLLCANWRPGGAKYQILFHRTQEAQSSWGGPRSPSKRPGAKALLSWLTGFLA